MKNRARMILIGVPVVLVAGLLLSGCKPEPELTQASAKALIQAKYDQTPPVGINVVVDELGFREGYTAKYWDRIKVYPNQFWADFKLTPEGKKAFKLPNGGDVIEWHPENAGDTHYTIILVTVGANHLKAEYVEEPESEVLPGASTAKGAFFRETQVLDGFPSTVQKIASTPVNKLSAKRHADFVLDGETWKLKSIE
ncbi:MAG: hypothetical protein ABSC47_04930 [Terracidiphilus sp.]